MKRGWAFLIFMSVGLLLIIMAFLVFRLNPYTDKATFSSRFSVKLEQMHSKEDFVEVHLQFYSDYPGRMLFDESDLVMITKDGEEVPCSGTTLVYDSVPNGITNAQAFFKTNIEDVDYLEIKEKPIRKIKIKDMED